MSRPTRKENQMRKAMDLNLQLKSKIAAGVVVALCSTSNVSADMWNVDGYHYISTMLMDSRVAIGYLNWQPGQEYPSSMLEVNSVVEDMLMLSYDSKKMVTLSGADAGSGANISMFNSAGSLVNSIDARSNKPTFFKGGNFGIGTDIPGQKLDVNGNANIRGSLLLDGDGQVIGNNYGGSYNDYWRMYMDKQTTDNGELHIKTGDNGTEPIYFEQATQSGSSIRMAVSANGRIGIGTPWPNSTLHMIDPVPGGSVFATLERTTLTTEAGFAFQGPNNKKFWMFQDQNSNDIRFETSGLAGEDDLNPRLELPSETKHIHACLSGGTFSVGTRTVDASKKLYVSGDAQVTGNIKVATITTGIWSIPPDYVFERDYKLASLDHVERFVNKNRHLPEIPSAKEMKEKGIDLAEMNLKLLKKVEELTLYSIQQEKRMRAMESKVESLQATRK
jgi:hypothetical protein